MPTLTVLTVHFLFLPSSVLTEWPNLNPGDRKATTTPCRLALGARHRWLFCLLGRRPGTPQTLTERLAWTHRAHSNTLHPNGINACFFFISAWILRKDIKESNYLPSQRQYFYNVIKRTATESTLYQKSGRYFLCIFILKFLNFLKSSNLLAE